MILLTKHQIRSIRAVVVGAAVSCLEMSAGGESAQLFAQVMPTETPLVTVTSGLTVGNLYRLGTTVIDRRSAQAAQYEVRGVKGRPARLSVIAIDLQSDGGTDRIPLRILPSDCVVSTNDGASWRPFSSGLLQEDLAFPATTDQSPTSVILVRVGASVTCDVVQSRGEYHGGIMLVAEYLPYREESLDLLYR